MAEVLLLTILLGLLRSRCIHRANCSPIKLYYTMVGVPKSIYNPKDGKIACKTGESVLPESRSDLASSEFTFRQLLGRVLPMDLQAL
jgi:hypothetical protein